MPDVASANFTSCNTKAAFLFFGNQGLLNGDLHAVWIAEEVRRWVDWCWARVRHRYATRWNSRKSAAEAKMKTLTQVWQTLWNQFLAKNALESGDQPRSLLLLAILRRFSYLVFLW
jgi:hypothetical protein